MLFSLDKIEIEFNIKALEEIANIAIEQDLGARGLRKILDSSTCGNTIPVTTIERKRSE